MAAYDVEKLMDETRRVAVLYRSNTGQTLPIGPELAKFDAVKYLPLTPVTNNGKNVDFIGSDFLNGNKVLLKSRVIFDERKTHYRLGKVNLAEDWDTLVLILYDDDYQPFEILLANKASLIELFPDCNINPQVIMSLAKFKSVALSVWNDVDGLTDSDIWVNI